jgi:hypothetical protein
VSKPTSKLRDEKVREQMGLIKMGKEIFLNKI